MELYIAAKSGRREALESLLRSGADINTLSSRGRTALFFAAEEGNKTAAKLLLEMDGIDPNLQDEFGQTLLQWAAEKGNEAILKLLVGVRDIEPNLQDKRGRTALSLAAEKGNEAVVKLLLGMRDIDRNLRDKNGRTALWFAIENGKQAVVGLLLEDSADRNPPGRTLLSGAAESGNEAEVRLLLTRGDDPNLKDNGGETPLSRAAKNGHKAVIKLLAPKDKVTLHMLLQEGKIVPAELLLSAQYNLDTKDSLGRTPLHVAILLAHSDMARKLISFGANINSKDADGTTPLRLAVQQKDQDLTELLLARSALTKGIMADEWLGVYHRESRDIVQLSAEPGEKSRVLFFSGGISDELSHTSVKPGRRLFVFADYKRWPKELITDSKGELQPNELKISYAEENNGQGTRVSVSLWFPAKRDSSRRHFNLPDLGQCRIAWSIIPPSNPDSEPWKSVDHYSTLPNGWIPDDGIDFFAQFVLFLEERWSNLCDLAEEHLTNARRDQLFSEGKAPELMHRLAKDAQMWTELRSTLQDQVRTAKNFSVHYSQRYNANQTAKHLQQIIDEFEINVKDRISRLDQTVRDLLQIEFAWASINESRISTRLGQNVMLLTYVSIFYLPLAFCAALWAIPNITDSSTRDPFVITSAVVGLITLVIAFNLDNIIGLIGKLYNNWRAEVVGKMRADDRWKERGDRLHEINFNQRTPSEWLLVGYLMDRLAGKFRGLPGKKRKQGDEESEQDGNGTG